LGAEAAETSSKISLELTRLIFFSCKKRYGKILPLQNWIVLEVEDKFFWSWLPANGHSGGILVGFRDSVFEIGLTIKGTFLVVTQVCVKASHFLFEFVGVYGPADHSRSGAFLAELEEVVTRAQYPMVVAGDFNLIRGRADKNNMNIDWLRVNLFNDCIACLHLSEVVRSGARFTWSNK
jgi:hypothetical protein